MKIPVLVIFAPTATGKTEVVGRLFSDNAPSFFAGKTEIISADSVQVYRDLNIGSAKPQSEFLNHLPHHLVNICELSENFGSGQFLSCADEAARKIYESGKMPVLCGGTAFYIKNFIFGSPITPTSDEKIRLEIQNRLKNEGGKVLYNELCKVDFEYSKKIHQNDEYRICRALEVYYSSGKPLSSFELPQKPRSQYDFCVINLVRSREQLYERINQRVLEMFDLGLVDEVKNLLKNVVKRDSTRNIVSSDFSSVFQKFPGMNAIGYREFFTSGENPYEMFDLLDKNELVDGISFSQSPRYLVWLSEVKRQIQKNTRHYAKKQDVFFRQVENAIDVHSFYPDEIKKIENLVAGFYERI